LRAQRTFSPPLSPGERGGGEGTPSRLPSRPGSSSSRERGVDRREHLVERLA
jgi:hypothetical protein